MPPAAAAAEHGELLRTVAAAREAEAEARRQLDELSRPAPPRCPGAAAAGAAVGGGAARAGAAHAARGQPFGGDLGLDSMSIVVVAEGAALFVAGYALRGFVDGSVAAAAPTGSGAPG